MIFFFFLQSDHSIITTTQIKTSTILAFQKPLLCPFPVITPTQGNHLSDFYNYSLVLPGFELI